MQFFCVLYCRFFCFPGAKEAKNNNENKINNKNIAIGYQPHCYFKHCIGPEFHNLHIPIVNYYFLRVSYIFLHSHNPSGPYLTPFIWHKNLVVFRKWLQLTQTGSSMVLNALTLSVCGCYCKQAASLGLSSSCPT